MTKILVAFVLSIIVLLVINDLTLLKLFKGSIVPGKCNSVLTESDILNLKPLKIFEIDQSQFAKMIDLNELRSTLNLTVDQRAEMVVSRELVTVKETVNEESKKLMSLINQEKNGLNKRIEDKATELQDKFGEENSKLQDEMRSENSKLNSHLENMGTELVRVKGTIDEETEKLKTLINKEKNALNKRIEDKATELRDMFRRRHSKLQDEINSEISKLKDEMNSENSKLKTQVQNIQTELGNEISNLKKDLEAVKKTQDNDEVEFVFEVKKFREFLKRPIHPNEVFSDLFWGRGRLWVFIGYYPMDPDNLKLSE